MKNHSFANDTEYIAFRSKDLKTFVTNDVKCFANPKNASYYKDKNINTIDDFINYIFTNSYTIDKIKKIALSYNYSLSDAGADFMIKWLKEEMAKAHDKHLKTMGKCYLITNKYKPLLDKAQEMAQNLDLSGLADGFPCGSAFVYVSDKNHELAKALHYLHGNRKEKSPFDYNLNIQFKDWGQCIDYERKQADIVEAFLRDNDLPVATYSWID